MGAVTTFAGAGGVAETGGAGSRLSQPTSIEASPIVRSHSAFMPNGTACGRGLHPSFEGVHLGVGLLLPPGSPLHHSGAGRSR